MSKKAVVQKLTETLDYLTGASPSADNKPMTAAEIAKAKAQKAKGADKRTRKTAGKKAAPKKKAKKSKR